MSWEMYFVFKMGTSPFPRNFLWRSGAIFDAAQLSNSIFLGN